MADGVKIEGALWKRQGTKGEFLAGVIKINGVDYDIVAFQNRKEKPNHPDYRILPGTKKGGSKDAPQGSHGDRKPAF